MAAGDMFCEWTVNSAPHIIGIQLSGPKGRITKSRKDFTLISVPPLCGMGQHKLLKHPVLPGLGKNLL